MRNKIGLFLSNVLFLAVATIFIAGIAMILAAVPAMIIIKIAEAVSSALGYELLFGTMTVFTVLTALIFIHLLRYTKNGLIKPTSRGT